MKLRQLIDMNSLVSHLEVARNFTDANGILLGKQLTHVDPKIFQKLYPDNVFLNSGITIDNTGGYGNQIQKLRISEKGGFANSTDRGTNKGLISLDGEDAMIGVIERQATINYTDTEIQQAKMGNYNIVEKLLGATDKIYRQEIDEILAVGNTLNQGLLNYSGFTADSGSDIASMSGTDAYDIFAELITDQKNGVNNTNGYMANRVLTSTKVMNIISSKKWKPETSEKSVLTMLREDFPEITFLSSWRANSVNGVSVTVAYATSEDAMTVRIPMPLLIGETVKEGSFGYRADAKYRIAGLDVNENKAGRILTGL
ncbi:DUF2184 domain-containing protein [Arcobacter lanthieri]|uniref:major capsid family protein n=1 Tax=Aliarcobacter lanthieri TaxID=1355374 RepID=UPI001924804B|nr:major capsid family protein [Aliarcobacter lanthieri]MBL3520298.1 DUF2184 domain-containing protein [Aliarcobacter lanthieri]